METYSGEVGIRHQKSIDDSQTQWTAHCQPKSNRQQVCPYKKVQACKGGINNQVGVKRMGQ